MKFKIRAARFSDLDPLSQLFDGYRVYYQPPSDVAKARNFLAERLQNNDLTIFVAETEDQDSSLLGFAQLYPIFSSVNARKSLLLNDLFVAPAARRSGVARQLMQQASEFARSKDACWLMLQAEKTNHNAQALYESLGFVRDSDCYYYYQPLT